MLLTEKLGSDVKSGKGSCERAREFGLILFFEAICYCFFTEVVYSSEKVLEEGDIPSRFNILIASRKAELANLLPLQNIVSSLICMHTLQMHI